MRNLTLQSKIQAILVVFLILALVNAVIIFYVVGRQKANSRAINLAGRQRMLTQKMSKEVFVANSLSADKRQEVIKGIKNTANLFDTTLKGLINGDKSLKLSAVDNQDIRQKLLEVQGMWSEFYSAINDYIGNTPTSAAAARAMDTIMSQNIPLLRTMNAAVSLYEKDNSIDHILYIQGIILFFFLLVAGLAWLYTNRSIIIPVRRISATLGASAGTLEGIADTVFKSAESVADRASSQAAATEESSASLEEITSMTRQNAESTNSANGEMHATKKVVENAYTAMEEMNQAMDDIRTASEETQKIVKTIDEIAFQTNLLSLNAAVEAARAGEAGAGFAVVADEVRNLAIRSANSAHDTSALIEDIVQRIEGGSTLVGKVTVNFKEVAAGASKVAVLLEDITSANKEQSVGVDQISAGIVEMDKLTQENAATSEESASAAKEMHSETIKLNNMVVKLEALIEGGQ
ncbi:MAG: hypothetical protein GXP59_09670 [Deltaproteobacteria bacterium]|nr:hypothetical protein [Deltaproteobacteria bacterium]